MPDPRYLPTPVASPNMPPPPLPRCNTSKYTRMKRVKVDDDTQMRDPKKICLEKDRLSWGGNELWMQQPIFGSRLPLHSADALSVYSQLSLQALSQSESAFTPTTQSHIPMSTSPIQTSALTTPSLTTVTESRAAQEEAKPIEVKTEPEESKTSSEEGSTTTFSFPMTADSAELNCMNCNILLEGTDFVQCPAVRNHKFCFNCTRTAIKEMLPGDVCCPSGIKCPLEGTSSPWTFMKREISTILGNAEVQD